MAPKTGPKIHWAVSGPVESDNHLVLYAFDPRVNSGAMTLLFSVNAGDWQNTGGNPNIVPTVANGLVLSPVTRRFGYSLEISNAIDRCKTAEFDLQEKDVRFSGDRGEHCRPNRVREAAERKNGRRRPNSSPRVPCRWPGWRWRPVTVVGTKEVGGIVKATGLGRAKERAYWAADVFR